MKRIGSKLAVGITTAVFLCGISAGQAGPTSSLSANSPSITVPFMAEDAHGKTMGTVKSPDLLVLDKQKHQQTILSIRTAKDLPLRLGVLIDTSGSARGSGCTLRQSKRLLIS